MNCVPQPVPQRVVCSLCDEDWYRHGSNPTTLDCIRLLKERRNLFPVVRPQPWFPPRPTPYWIANDPNYRINNSSDAIEKLSGDAVQYRTPSSAEVRLSGVSA